MQRDEAVDIEAWSDVSAGKHEGDGHAAAVAPREDQALAFGENFFRDPGQASCRAILEGIHARVVEAEVEGVTPLVRFAEDLPNRGEIVSAARDDHEPRLLARNISIVGIDCDIELRDARLVGDQRFGSSATMSVEIQE